MLDLNRDNLMKLYVEILLRLQRQMEKLWQELGLGPGFDFI